MVRILSDITTIIVAIEALGIMCLEVWGTQTKVAQRAFNLSAEYLKQEEAQLSMANQGLYNGFIGVGILIVRFGFPTVAVYPGLLLFIGFVVVAAIFGALTVTKKIILTQGMPAMLALILLVINEM
ncbi:DUF1304 domain-containing protein [Liquorilactobacillus capillatus]|uniref:Integral membrane protein n=1 Tax=Liquorilactobacillus capillatus DSM 19910 TaxID=1423731 RepID=A0A0R1M5B0_9LACO|nr:DUF1304 domain-containing protein [Liquorilactobacillus capillatus]KRL00226.1 hypothetical protein FC81_GL000124 [Liquorilactobacillus capillatus DSM 19910]